MELLTILFLGQPLWMWLGFMTLVVVLLALDLGVLHRGSREIGIRESLALSAFYIVLGLTFGGFVWWQLGSTAGIEYLTGFVVEKSLAVDNIFVIATIFGYLAIPRRYQHRVLFWGILGVIVLRAVMIGFGATLVAQYSWILYLFAVFLIATGIVLGLTHAASAGSIRIPLGLRPLAELAYFTLFPTLLAYLFWDVAMRKGHVVLVVSFSFFAPLISTLISCLYLGVPMGHDLWMASALIIVGAAICQRSVR